MILGAVVSFLQSHRTAHHQQARLAQIPQSTAAKSPAMVGASGTIAQPCAPFAMAPYKFTTTIDIKRKATVKNIVAAQQSLHEIIDNPLSNTAKARSSRKQGQLRERGLSALCSDLPNLASDEGASELALPASAERRCHSIALYLL